MPFIPRGKPKSWVLFILFLLIALLIAGPAMFLGGYLNINVIQWLGTTMFVVCWIISFTSWLVFFGGMLSGKYRDIKEQEWNKQAW